MTMTSRYRQKLYFPKNPRLKGTERRKADNSNAISTERAHEIIIELSHAGCLRRLLSHKVFRSTDSSLIMEKVFEDALKATSLPDEVIAITRRSIRYARIARQFILTEEVVPILHVKYAIELIEDLPKDKMYLFGNLAWKHDNLLRELKDYQKNLIENTVTKNPELDNTIYYIFKLFLNQ